MLPSVPHPASDAGIDTTLTANRIKAGLELKQSNDVYYGGKLGCLVASSAPSKSVGICDPEADAPFPPLICSTSGRLLFELLGKVIKCRVLRPGGEVRAVGATV